METELISVIVPVYNVERYLRRCVDSILHQTYRNLEVLLVDDGSTDASGAICDKYAAQEERVTAVHQKNGGLSAARNAGLERAQGTYLCFVDSDDFLDSRMLETLCRDLQEQDADVAVVGFRMFEREEALAPAELTVPVQCMTGREAIRSTLVSDELGDFAWNKLYKRAMFDTLRFRDGKRYEDQFFMLDVLRRCQTVACLGYQGYRYVQHSASTMAVAGVASNYLERPEYLLEWSRYFAEKGNYLRAEGLLNDAIENLSQKENFDLSTQRQQARYHELRHSCAEVYRLLSHRTGRESMLLRAGLLRLGLPLYRIFLKHKT